MSDKPILFSAPMVRALLAGTKTQTRRLGGVPVIEQTPNGLWHIHNRHGGEIVMTPAFSEEEIGKQAADYLPIQPGDRLYVREAWRTWAQYDGTAPRNFTPGTHIAYEATENPNLGGNAGKFRQGMHMPRWASRITLTVTDVRVQRLQDISARDAVAEGIRGNEFEGWFDYSPGEKPCDFLVDPRKSYRTLWEAINGPGSWDANHWVAAYTFTVEQVNIDMARAAA